MELSPYKAVARPFIFLLDPETAHGLARWVFGRAWLWRLCRRFYSVDDERLQVVVGHLKLGNPVGLAAGFDKDCKMVPGLANLGYGYLTVGTVTLNPREGNPKPRVWRYPNDSLVNSMGLPNEGTKKIAERLSKNRKRAIPIIASISGLSVEEFVGCYREIEQFSDGIELNVSTPNTQGVWIFQEPQMLSKLFTGLSAVRTPGKALWVKIPPYFGDKDRENVLELIDVCLKNSVDALTATNTKRIEEERAAIGFGGLSGRMIYKDTLRIVSDVYKQTGGRIPINACGGISSGLDAWRAIEVGASSVQLYTGLVYEGPGVAARINRELLRLMQTAKIGSLAEVKGAALR